MEHFNNSFKDLRQRVRISISTVLGFRDDLENELTKEIDKLISHQ